MIAFEIPNLPPSLNHAYVSNGFGGRTLSTAGKAYKKTTTTHIVRAYPAALRFFVEDEPYAIYVRFYFPNLENKGWPTKTSSRYKQQDATNRVKLFEDALKDAAGIDDSQHLVFCVEKRYGETEKTDVFVWSLNYERTPFDGLLGLAVGQVQPHRALPAVPESQAPSTAIRSTREARRATRRSR